ncbi:unnamed protein product [Amoebophrya sp. A25]|nr:unnamed protein product [Amoebophrya sp. A25]|eukprot:GSA25T00002233001.1
MERCNLFVGSFRLLIVLNLFVSFFMLLAVSMTLASGAAPLRKPQSAATGAGGERASVPGARAGVGRAQDATTAGGRGANGNSNENTILQELPSSGMDVRNNATTLQLPSGGTDVPSGRVTVEVERTTSYYSSSYSSSSWSSSSPSRASSDSSRGGRRNEPSRLYFYADHADIDDIQSDALVQREDLDLLQHLDVEENEQWSESHLEQEGFLGGRGSLSQRGRHQSRSGPPKVILRDLRESKTAPSGVVEHYVIASDDEISEAFASSWTGSGANTPRLLDSIRFAQKDLEDSERLITCRDNAIAISQNLNSSFDHLHHFDSFNSNMIAKNEPFSNRGIEIEKSVTFSHVEDTGLFKFENTANAKEHDRSEQQEVELGDEPQLCVDEEDIISDRSHSYAVEDYGYLRKETISPLGQPTEDVDNDNEGT